MSSCGSCGLQLSSHIQRANTHRYRAIGDCLPIDKWRNKASSVPIIKRPVCVCLHYSHQLDREGVLMYCQLVGSPVYHLTDADLGSQLESFSGPGRVKGLMADRQGETQQWHRMGILGLQLPVYNWGWQRKFSKQTHTSEDTHQQCWFHSILALKYTF